MRNIVNISLPKEMAADIKREVRRGKFASTSEFMRHLIRVWNTRKLAEELRREREQATYAKLLRLANADGRRYLLKQ